MSCEKCDLLNEMYQNTNKTQRDYFVMTELFVSLHDGDECKNEMNKRIIEKLAEYAHSAWAGWMKYLFEKSTLDENGSVTIPASLVERWMFQTNTEYKNLPDEMKPSDREEARKMLEIFAQYGNEDDDDA